MFADKFVDENALGFAFDGHNIEGAEVETVGHLLVSSATDNDVGAVDTVDRFQAAGKIHTIAHHGVIHTLG